MNGRATRLFKLEQSWLEHSKTCGRFHRRGQVRLTLLGFLPFSQTSRAHLSEILVSLKNDSFGSLRLASYCSARDLSQFSLDKPSVVEGSPVADSNKEWSWSRFFQEWQLSNRGLYEFCIGKGMVFEHAGIPASQYMPMLLSGQPVFGDLLCFESLFGRDKFIATEHVIPLKSFIKNRQTKAWVDSLGKMVDAQLGGFVRSALEREQLDFGVESRSLLPASPLDSRLFLVMRDDEKREVQRWIRQCREDAVVMSSDETRRKNAILKRFQPYSFKCTITDQSNYILMGLEKYVDDYLRQSGGSRENRLDIVVALPRSLVSELEQKMRSDDYWTFGSI